MCPCSVRLAKWILASPLRLPHMEAATGRANASRFFDVLKDASLRVARSDWTAVRVLFKMDNEKCRLLGDAMVASHGLRFMLPRTLA
jgi:hypothetical protein